MKTRAVVIGIILGLALSGRRLLDAVRGSGGQAGPETGARETTAGSTAGTTDRRRQSSGLGGTQHGDLGGVPPVEDADSLLMGGSAASEDAGNLAGASAYSSANGPYDADISEEGVTLTYSDPTDREGDVPLDEGIPNLGEPGDVADVGPETLAAEASVEDVEANVPEEYGQETPIDSVEHEDSWVADAPGEEDEIPAASRGLREYGEGDEDELDIEDTEETELFGLDEDAEPSGSGGEVDLENDEAPQGKADVFAVVDDPDQPLSADAGGMMIDPLAPEETLGLRDSESAGVGMEGDEMRSSLGMTGDYDDVMATERLRAAPGEADTSGDSGADRQASFATGDRGHEDVDDTGIDSASDEKRYGETGEFGVPVPEKAGPPIDTNESDRSVGTAGEQEKSAGPDTSEKPDDDEHLGISGDFDEAEKTEKIPAERTDGDEASEDSDRESYVTGDEPGQHASSSKDDAGYSAAWSTPAGVMGEWPNQEDGAKGFPDEETGASLKERAKETAEETSDHTGGKTAGESGLITSEAKDRAGVEMASSEDTNASGQAEASSDEYQNDPSGGDPADMAAASAGDLGAATPVTGGKRRQGEQDPFSVNPASGGAEDPATSNAPGAGEPGTPRKSRKQRRMEATDWIPAGAVKGDGTATCPTEYPIKGNANSRIYHRPTDPSYAPTIPEYCFATEEDAQHAGFRAPKG